MTEIGTLIETAMRRKGEELGSEYSYRDLGRDSGVHFTYAHKVVKGERHPSREMIRAWSVALHPYLPLDKALVAADYMPRDSRIRQWVREAVTVTNRMANALSPIEQVPNSQPDSGEHGDPAVDGRAAEEGGHEPQH